MNKWTEENQKAEFIGGAVSGGCFIIMVAFAVLFVISAFAFCSNGC